ncbi:hypothetical protein BG006_011369 [Podila minutissima]|uniref:Uncharacterized protein n=1 Tax=Podila minutissima TaxID=64525 RepID=A0A9P5VHM2_9FUNG|nr:hypothetical protein BG006_011369 [Podila minutissima]
MTPQQSILGIEAQIHPFAQGTSTTSNTGSIRSSANDSPEVELASLDLDTGNNDDNNQTQDHPLALQHNQLNQQPLSARAFVSIQLQHQQTFYIPQMQDDDEELEFEPVSSVAKSK